MLGEQYGERRIILLSIGGISVMCVLLALAPVFALFVVCCVLLGGFAGLHYAAATTRATVDHSLPYHVARVIIDGTIDPAELDEHQLSEDDVVNIFGKMDVVATNRSSKPTADAFSHAMTITTDSTAYERQVDHPQGHYKDPFSNTNVVNKLLHHSTCSTAAVTDLRKSIDELDKAADVDTVLRSASRISEGL